MRHSVRPRTLETYRGAVERYIVPALGHVRLIELRPEQVEGMTNAMIDRGLSKRTAASTRTVLRTALADAERKGLVGFNAAARAVPPKVEGAKVRAMTPEEVTALLESSAGDRLAALWRLAVQTVARRGELLGLLREDVDLDAGAISIRRTLQRIRGSLQLTEPKTASSVRRVPLIPSTVEALKAHREAQDFEREWAGARWTETGNVFTTTIVSPVDPSEASKKFRRAAERAGLEDVRLHACRHTAATLLLRQGVSPKVVADYLGHATVAVTLNVYSHVVPEMMDEAADRLSQFLD